MIFADTMVRAEIIPNWPIFKVDKMKGANPWALREHGMMTLPDDELKTESPIESVEKIIAVVDGLTSKEEGKPSNVDDAVLVSGTIDP